MPFEYSLPTPVRKLEDFLIHFFELEKRDVSIKSECFAGVVHFLTSMYVLPVTPQLLAGSGYELENVAVISAVVCGIGSIGGGLLTNLPIIIAPPTAICIYLNGYIEQKGLGVINGNQAVIISGCLILLLAYRPLSRFVGKLVPDCVQTSTAIGIGLLTALAGCVSVNIVIKGPYTLVAPGPLTAGLPAVFVTTDRFYYQLPFNHSINVIAFSSRVFQSLPSLLPV